MGARGPQPKATRLKILEGNPGQRRLPKAEVIPNEVAAKPAFIKGVAAKEWGRVIKAMPPGFYTAADIPVISIYCMAWLAYREACTTLAREGYSAIGSTGQAVAHPSVAIMQKQAETILKAADRLGMSPAARARLDVAAAPMEMDEKAPASKWDGLIDRPPTAFAKRN